MISQYDNIGSQYSVFKDAITSVIEEANIKAATIPYLQTENVRILDLASGTGHYSKKLIDWGASYVLGVDLSTAMVGAAKILLAENDKYKGKVNFQVGDALSLGKVEDTEPFDIVLGAWPLNYASSAEEMSRMFHTIVANLKDGDVSIGLTPYATEDVDALAARLTENPARVPGGFPTQVSFYERLLFGEGWKTEVSSTVGGNRVAFRNVHLKKSLYEESARRGGLNGKLEWPEIEVPVQAKAVLASEGWEAYVDEGQMGIILVEK